MDEPVRWRLADPRQLRTVGIEDRLYVRILDTAAAFEARGYQGRAAWCSTCCRPQASEGEADVAPGPLGAGGRTGWRLVPPGPTG